MTEFNRYRLRRFMREYKVLFSTIAAIVLLVCVLALTLVLTHHTHSYGEWERFSDPTCSTNGYERRYCACGYVQEKLIDCLPHTEGEWRTNDDGTRRELLCSVCGRVIRAENEPDHVHEWSDWSIIEEPLCTTRGKEARTCSCESTQERDINSLGHDFSEWTTTLSPTCETTGTLERTCSRCDKTESTEISSLGHTEAPSRIVGTEIQYYCERCSQLLRCEQMRSSVGLEIVDGTVVGLGSCTDTEIVVPNEHDGIPVVAIANGAFKNATTITSVILPQSISSVGDSAFLGCSSLTTMNLEFVADIGSDALAYCDSLASVRFGKSLTKIGRWVFEGSSSLATIHYDGSAEEWLLVEKADDWNKYAPTSIEIKFRD